jgi:roadblock/LC7 domain-containing protein
VSLVSKLCAIPGVLAAGEYSYHGDQYTYAGELDEEQARQVSVMCRATTMAIHMQADMLDTVSRPSHPLGPVKAWVVRGPRTTVCVVAHVFCFLDNETGPLNVVLELMQEALANESDDLIY